MSQTYSTISIGGVTLFFLNTNIEKMKLFVFMAPMAAKLHNYEAQHKKLVTLVKTVLQILCI